MQKKIVLILIGIILVLLAIFVYAVIIGFTKINPTTKKINHLLAQKLLSVVRIPQGIPPPFQGFDETLYFWEMETIEKEVTGVRFKYTPVFSNKLQTLEVVLEKPENDDSSIFEKVLPAVVLDKKTLDAVGNSKNPDLSANEEVGYNSIQLFVDEKTSKIVKIVWQFNKSKLGTELETEYQKLTLYPDWLLRFFDSLPKFIIGLLGV